MKSKKFKEAFSCVRASGDTVNAVLEIPAENEAPRRASGWQVVRRVAVCAAMLAVMLGAMVLPGPPVAVTDPTGGTQIVHRPLFSVQVYADDGYIDLGSEGNDVVFAGQENTDTASDFGRLDFYSTTPMIYNATTGEWEEWIIQKEEKLPSFDIVIWYHELPDKNDVNLEIYKDGERVIAGKQNRNFRTTLVFAMEDMEGIGIKCCLEEQADLEFIVKNKAGDILLQYKIRATPAIYETYTSDSATGIPDGDTWISQNEGYMLEVLEEYSITAD